MEVIELVECMRNICIDLQRQNRQIRFVPTMGSLHQGHTSLFMRAANDHQEMATDGNCIDPSTRHALKQQQKQQSAGQQKDFVVIVSIFVNPAQFNNRDDFLKYPKSLKNDLDICKKTQCVDYVFVPKCQEIYKSSTTMDVDASQSCRVTPPQNCIAQDLEGRSRPGHFEGMLTVVAKLFNIIRPDRAYFGEKDYQQLLLVTQMVEDLCLSTSICPVETVREGDTNLPLSSRNVRLNAGQRRLGAVMFDILMGAKEALEQRCCRKSTNNRDHDKSLESDLDAILLSSMLAAKCLREELSNDDDDDDDENRLQIDYFELRCAKDLTTISYDQKLECYDCQQRCAQNSKTNQDFQTDVLRCRLLISVMVANVRLLDNMEVMLNL